MTDLPGRTRSVRGVGTTILVVFCLLSLIWPMGNIADNYGGDRGPGNTRVVLTIWAIGSLLVYLSQRLRWGGRKGTSAGGAASLEIPLGCAAALMAIHIGCWTGSRPMSLGLFFELAGIATGARAIWVNWERLGTFERALSVAADLMLMVASGMQLLAHGFSDLGFSNHVAVAAPSPGTSLWFLLATLLPVALAIALGIRTRLKR